MLSQVTAVKVSRERVAARDKSGSHILIIIVLTGRQSAQHMILAQTNFLSANHAR